MHSVIVTYLLCNELCHLADSFVSSKLVNILACSLVSQNNKDKSGPHKWLRPATDFVTSYTNACEHVNTQYALLELGSVLQTSPELYDGGARSSRNSGGAAELDDAWFSLESCGG